MKSTSIQHFQDRYRIAHTEDGKQFLKWDEKSDLQIKDQDFNWGSLFEANPYLIYNNGSTGQIFPDVTIFSFRAEAEESKAKYDMFLKGLKVSKHPMLAEISQLKNYLDLATKQLKEGLNRLEDLDKNIIAVLKVFLFEALKHAEAIEYDNIQRNVQEFYQTGIRRFCSSDLLQNHYAPYFLKPINLDVTIKESAILGIMYYVYEKESIINKLTPTYDKFIFLEAIVTQVLNDGKLESAEPGKSIESAKNEFQKNLIKLGEGNEPMRSDLIEVANQIIYNEGDGRLQDYFGKKGWPLKILWDHQRVRRMKYVLPAEPTLRRWLAEAFKDGEIRPPAHGQLTVSSREKADPR